MSTKRCFKCLCEKPLGAFYKHAMMGDGHLNKCIDCTKRDVAEHRQKNLESIRAYDRMRASKPHRMALSLEMGKRWRANYPNRKAAQSKLRNAVLSGAIKPLPCQVCGSKAEAHHPDYDRPLDVVWLCPPHHRQAHALVSNEDQIKDVA